MKKATTMFGIGTLVLTSACSNIPQKHETVTTGIQERVANCIERSDFIDSIVCDLRKKDTDQKIPYVREIVRNFLNRNTVKEFLDSTSTEVHNEFYFILNQYFENWLNNGHTREGYIHLQQLLEVLVNKLQTREERYKNITRFPPEISA